MDTFALKEEMYKELIGTERIVQQKKNSLEYSNTIDYRIKKFVGLYKSLQQTNGLYRILKMEALWRLIGWYTAKKNVKFCKCVLDQRSLLENPWFFGFLKADSSFAASMYNQKQNVKGTIKLFPKVFS